MSRRTALAAQEEDSAMSDDTDPVADELSLDDSAERGNSGASWVDDVGGIAAGQGFGHLAAAGIADADEKNFSAM